MSRSKSAQPIRLRGVRQNNLKGFDVDIPVDRLVVVTGPSGSGKSSLAFDTLYAEGQRRYIETFSPYARQFFDRMDKPRVDRIEDIPPAIAIEQRNAVRSTRSTVGTMTEICDHMKVIWPHLAPLYCRACGQRVHREPPLEVWKAMKAAPGAPPSTALISFDLPLSSKLSLDDSLALIAKQGYQRLLVDGEVLRLEDAPAHPAFGKPRSSLTVVQDRVRLTNRTRFIEACEQAYHFGKGRLTVHPENSPATSAREAPGTPPAPRRFSNHLHCAGCDIDYPAPSPALFSFNHPVGACPACKGFGRTITIDYHLAIPDRRKSLKQGAIKPWQSGMSAECQRDLLKFCRAMKVPVDTPFRDLSPDHQRWIIEGDPDYGSDEEHEWPRAWYGVKGYFRWLESKSYKMHVRVLLSRYRAYTPCPDCAGARLKPEALLFRINDPRPTPLGTASVGQGPSTDTPRTLTLPAFYALPLSEAFELIDRLCRSAFRAPHSAFHHALVQVRSRLAYLNDIGLGYLTLDRATRTLSGGETARVNLATCLGTRLVNTLFVLDEPSVGLHPRDTDRLVQILHALRDEGNTVVVVEHERNIIESADQILDLGPGHGAAGGELVFQGSLKKILGAKRSLTGRYLNHRTNVPLPARRTVESPNRRRRRPKPTTRDRPTSEEVRWLGAQGANRHNLKNISVDIPLNRFVCLSGVSGSGKSTLLKEVLLPALEEQLGASEDTGKASDRMDDPSSSASSMKETPTRLSGAEHLGAVVVVDQSSLGKTPRSNPAVYTGAFDHIRDLFARSQEAKRQGLNASAFSFNSPQGQCERCRGAGFEKVEMQFLSDIFIRCPDCNGRRYREHVLDCRLPLADGGSADTARQLSIADVLDATVDEAVAFLEGFPDAKPAHKAVAALNWLQDVGLGYLQLGQPINTLSGGESQRLKLVRHLAAAAQPATHTHRQPAAPGAPPTPVHPTLFLLDEPTTGLHFDDVRILLNALQRLVDAGHSVLVVEHNLDVLKCADWIIDLGPEAGEAGGQVVVAGTPETVARCKTSHTGQHLAASLICRGKSRVV